MLKQLKEDEEKKKKQFRGNVPAPIRNALGAKRKEVQQAEQKNEAIFYAATRQLFETLYHEAICLRKLGDDRRAAVLLAALHRREEVGFSHLARQWLDFRGLPGARVEILGSTIEN